MQVSDTGPGIPAELREGLFTRASFPTGQRRNAAADAGGGLGLAIVRRILQLHGSDIRLIEQADKGAAFHFQFNASASR